MRTNEEPQQSASQQDPWGAPSGSDCDDAVTDIFFAEHNGSRYRIALSDLEKLGSGGTAIVYLVKNGACKDKVVKLYKTEKLNKRRAELERKAKKMLLSPPKNADVGTTGNSTPQFAWPEGLLFDEAGLFCGLLLPYINGKDAYNLETYLKEIASLEKKHQSITERIQVAQNLAAAVSQLHKAGHYFVDMKAMNIFVFKETSTVCFIDCDGFSINRGEFPAKEYTKGYIAPEGLGCRPEQLSESPAQDYYVLALLIFQLLDYNNTPYACRVEDKNLHSENENSTMDDLARKGLYAYGLTSTKGLVPREHSIYRYWPIRVRELFDRAFTSKNGRERPSAAEWFDVLHEVVKRWDFEKCAKYPGNETHRHFKGTSCFACEVFGKISAAATDAEPDKQKTKSKTGNAKGATSYEEPKPPSHWTDLLPQKYDRLRNVRRKLVEGTRLPISSNIIAAPLQFFWLLSHGLIGPGLASGMLFLIIGLMAVWNPDILPLLVTYLVITGTTLFLFADSLLYRRIDQQVETAGGFQNIDAAKLEQWLGRNHQGWVLGIAIVVMFAGSSALRMHQVKLVIDNINNAINNTGTLKENILVFARKNNFQVPLSGYKSNSQDYQPSINSDADVFFDGEDIVLTLKNDTLMQGKRVRIRPKIIGDQLDWSRCWSEENRIPEHMMPERCRTKM